MKFAHELTEGMTIYVNGSEVVTRRDSEFISNGVVRFTATNGFRYGLNRLDILRFPPSADSRQD